MIPPGGEGSIRVILDSRAVAGRFRKHVTVFSNDPERRAELLTVEGEVKPAVTLEPGGYAAMTGRPGAVPKEELLIVNHHDAPLRITGVRSDMPDRIHCRIEEIQPGVLFRLTVEDRLQTPGRYAAHLIVDTDQPLKPRLVVIVRGDVAPAE